MEITHNDDHPGGLYLSGRHAADCYVRMRVRMLGCPAIDYERPMIQVSSAPVNPHLLCLHDVWALEGAFVAARRRVGEGSKRWAAWVAIRINEQSYREVARELDVDSATVQRWCKDCDRKVEDALNDVGLLVRNHPRLHQEPYQ